ncbi:MAG TPA: hypothetical protein VE010_01555, partial [Thermoanaerobaculia bacterium]|nr:hypothetical protein [Thermoanaerobaculia bacterium]
MKVPLFVGVTACAVYASAVLAVDTPPAYPCRYIETTILSLNVNSSSVTADNRVTCYNEHTNVMRGHFEGRAYIRDETGGTIVAQRICPRWCYDTFWSPYLTATPSPEHCYRSRLEASSTFYSQAAGSALQCDESGGGGGGGGDQEDWCASFPESCGCPLILDLDGDGIHTTDMSQPVRFDIDGDGAQEMITWTDASTFEAFLWLDSDPDGVVNDGGELFGIGTTLVSGALATNGFQALSAFDQPSSGGDSDGRITSADAVWSRLRLWVDANHDGVSQRTEVAPIHRYGVTELRLEYTIDRRPDSSGNYHFLRGTYVRRI